MPIDRKSTRLIVALSETPVATPPIASSATSLTDIVEQVLREIEDRLRAGLDPAWAYASRFGHSADPATDANEAWARQVVEMMSGVPYAGPGVSYQIYNGNEGNDEIFYDNMLAGGGYPLTAACQHLCTVALITRGFGKTDIGRGCNAGGTKGIGLFQHGGGRWIDDGRALKNVDAAIAGGVTPGALYEFYDHPNVEPAHIAFVLRTHSSGWNGLQFFDTGGLNFSNRRDGVFSGSSGNFDDPWNSTEDVKGQSTGIQGVGLLPAQSDADVRAGVAAAKRLRPLGFARVTVTDLANVTVRPAPPDYVSKLLPMHVDNLNFSFARYVWSLRGTAGSRPRATFTSQIETSWTIYLPRGELAPRVLASNRSTSIAQMLRGDPPGLPIMARDGRTPLADKPDEPIPAAHLRQVLKITMRFDPNNPQVTFLEGGDFVKDVIPDPFPWGRPSGSVAPHVHAPPYISG